MTIASIMWTKIKFVRLLAVQAVGHRPNEEVTYLSHALVVIKLTCLFNIHPYIHHSNVGGRPTLVYLLQQMLSLVGLIYWSVKLASNDAPVFSGPAANHMMKLYNESL